MTDQAEGTTLSGGCHCGNLTFRLTASGPPETLPVRACGCGFCRLHGALTTSDPAGHVAFAVQDPARLNRYRFGLKTADFLVCRDCGVYVGALMPDGTPGGADAYAILNLRTCDEAERFTEEPAAMDYGGEDEAARLARRRDKWTPADPEVQTIG